MAVCTIRPRRTYGNPSKHAVTSLLARTTRPFEAHAGQDHPASRRIAAGRRATRERSSSQVHARQAPRGHQCSRTLRLPGGRRDVRLPQWLAKGRSAHLGMAGRRSCGRRSTATCSSAIRRWRPTASRARCSTKRPARPSRRYRGSIILEADTPTVARFADRVPEPRGVVGLQVEPIAGHRRVGALDTTRRTAATRPLPGSPARRARWRRMPDTPPRYRHSGAPRCRAG